MLQFQVSKENIVKIIVFILTTIVSGTVEILFERDFFITLFSLIILGIFLYLYILLKNKQLKFVVSIILISCFIFVLVRSVFSVIISHRQKDEERPLLTLKQTKLIEIGDSLCIGIFFENIGKTTAYKIEHKIGLKIGGNGITPKEWDSVYSSYVKGVSILEPSNQGSGIICNKISKDDYRRIIIEGSKNLFVFGLITYTDNSKKGKYYYRQYCFKYHPRLGVFEDYDNCNDSK
ncbi:MAG: hypothetical protein N2053_05210 [Chitinispirillaceae bacterium]|nr:hypothetical protein [Chitinispirillaceae bacterium]